jgi:hypothetical protein
VGDCPAALLLLLLLLLLSLLRAGLRDSPAFALQLLLRPLPAAAAAADDDDDDDATAAADAADQAAAVGAAVGNLVLAASRLLLRCHLGGLCEHCTLAFQAAALAPS